MRRVAYTCLAVRASWRSDDDCSKRIFRIVSYCTARCRFDVQLFGQSRLHRCTWRSRRLIAGHRTVLQHAAIRAGHVLRPARRARWSDEPTNQRIHGPIGRSCLQASTCTSTSSSTVSVRWTGSRLRSSSFQTVTGFDPPVRPCRRRCMSTRRRFCSSRSDTWRRRRRRKSFPATTLVIIIIIIIIQFLQRRNVLIYRGVDTRRLALNINHHTLTCTRCTNSKHMSANHSAPNWTTIFSMLRCFSPLISTFFAFIYFFKIFCSISFYRLAKRIFIMFRLV